MVSCLVNTESGQRFGAVLQDEDKTNALVEGLYSGRGYQIGDRIYLDRQTIVITGFFTGVDYLGRTREMFAYTNECFNCGQPYTSSDDRKANHEGPYGMKCLKRA